MLGLFKIMPVISVHTKTMPGDTASFWHLAPAISRATASLRWARTTSYVVGRMIQDVGGSTGMSFAVAIAGALIVLLWVSMSGLFALVGVFSILAVGVVIWVMPDAPSKPVHVRAPFAEVLHNVELLRLNFGVLVLHATQTALFLVVPRLLVDAGLPVASHWMIYLPVMGLAFVLMVPAIIVAEKRGKMKAVLLSAIGLILIGQLLLGSLAHTLVIVSGVLFVYFLGFNILEASQPSLVSKLAPGRTAGAREQIRAPLRQDKHRQKPQQQRAFVVHRKEPVSGPDNDLCDQIPGGAVEPAHSGIPCPNEHPHTGKERDEIREPHREDGLRLPLRLLVEHPAHEEEHAGRDDEDRQIGGRESEAAA